MLLDYLLGDNLDISSKPSSRSAPKRRKKTKDTRLSENSNTWKTTESQNVVSKNNEMFLKTKISDELKKCLGFYFFL